MKNSNILNTSLKLSMISLTVLGGTVGGGGMLIAVGGKLRDRNCLRTAQS